MFVIAIYVFPENSSFWVVSVSCIVLLCVQAIIIIALSGCGKNGGKRPAVNNWSILAQMPLSNASIEFLQRWFSSPPLCINCLMSAHGAFKNYPMCVICPVFADVDLDKQASSEQWQPGSCDCGYWTAYLGCNCTSPLLLIWTGLQQLNEAVLFLTYF